MAGFFMADKNMHSQSSAVSIAGGSACQGLPGHAVNPSLGAPRRHPCRRRSRQPLTGTTASHFLLSWLFFSATFARSGMRDPLLCWPFPGPSKPGMAEKSYRDVLAACPGKGQQRRGSASSLPNPKESKNNHIIPMNQLRLTNIAKHILNLATLAPPNQQRFFRIVVDQPTGDPLATLILAGNHLATRKLTGYNFHIRIFDAGVQCANISDTKSCKTISTILVLFLFFLIKTK